MFSSKPSVLACVSSQYDCDRVIEAAKKLADEEDCELRVLTVIRPEPDYTIISDQIEYLNLAAKEAEEEAKRAQEAAKALFSTGNAADMPTAELTAEDFTDGVSDVINILVKSGLVPTRSEGRRAIEQGGVSIDGEKVTDIKATVAMDSISEEGIVVKRGKKNFRKVIVK